jgi:hypothetical protein
MCLSLFQKPKSNEFVAFVAAAHFPRTVSIDWSTCGMFGALNHEITLRFVPYYRKELSSGYAKRLCCWFFKAAFSLTFSNWQVKCLCIGNKLESDSQFRKIIFITTSARDFSDQITQLNWTVITTIKLQCQQCCDKMEKIYLFVFKLTCLLGSEKNASLNFFYPMIIFCWKVF